MKNFALIFKLCPLFLLVILFSNTTFAGTITGPSTNLCPGQEYEYSYDITGWLARGENYRWTILNSQSNCCQTEKDVTVSGVVKRYAVIKIKWPAFPAVPAGQYIILNLKKLLPLLPLRMEL